MEAKPGGPATGGLFQTKSLDAILQDAEKPEYQLRRALGPVQLTLFGIGAIVGAGIFATIGTAAAGDAARPGAGPALMVSFIITAIVCGFTALAYAEFAAMVPISGSAYTYSYATLGELIAWVIGWDLIIEYAVGNIAVAISWSHYFKTLVEGFGLSIPDWLAMDYRTAARIHVPTSDFQMTAVGAGVAGAPTALPTGNPTILDLAPHVLGLPIVFNLLAVGIVVFITLILVWGIRESARFNAIMVGIKLIVLAFFIIVGWSWVKPENWTTPRFMPNGWAGVSAGAAIIFFAYIGFDAVSTVAEETRNPQRNLPIAIMASLVICTVLYIVVAAVFTGMIPYKDLETWTSAELAEPLTKALQRVDPKNSDWAVGFVAFGSVIAHTAVLLVFQLGQPRIFFAMSRDGLLPPAFAKVHPRYRTPYVGTILTGVFVAGVAAVASIDEMVDLTNIGTLFAFILVCLGIVVLRIKEPNRPRPFKAPGGIAVPILGVVSCLYLIYYLPPASWLRFAAWLNFGFVIYIGYGVLHSRLTGRHLSERPAEHDARTAHAGAWLALLGVVLLLAMRGLDVFLGAVETQKADGGEAAGPGWFAAAFSEIWKGEAWLTLQPQNAGELPPAWFLIVPLTLNAFVLCPIIIRRALRAWRQGGAAVKASRGRTSIALAAALMAATVVYFVLIVRHHLHGPG